MSWARTGFLVYVYWHLLVLVGCFIGFVGFIGLGKKRWSLPGASVQNHETPWQAVCRGVHTKTIYDVVCDPVSVPVRSYSFEDGECEGG